MMQMMHLTNNIGIYKITNTVNGKIYIGQSINLNKRIMGHKSVLSKGKHQNSYLQHSFNKYGKDCFTFEIIEICESDNLNTRENYWIMLYKSHESEYGYNMDIPTSGEKKRIVSKATGKKISDSKRMFTKEELISYLQDFYYMEGRIPTQRDFQGKSFGDYPSYSVFVNRYGNFKNALISADIYVFATKPFAEKEVSDKEAIEKYTAFIKAHGRFPNSYERRKASDNDLPAESTITRKFGSIGKFKMFMGFTKEQEIDAENNKSLEMLQLLYNEQGFITARMIDKSSITRSVQFYSNRFGSLFNAYQLAGINPENNNVKGNSYTASYEKFCAKEA